MGTHLYNGDRQPDGSVDRHCALNLKKKIKKKKRGGGFFQVFLLLFSVPRREQTCDTEDVEMRRVSGRHEGGSLVPNFRACVLSARRRQNACVRYLAATKLADGWARSSFNLAYEGPGWRPTHEHKGTTPRLSRRRGRWC